MNFELIYPHHIPSTPSRTNQSHYQLHVCSIIVGATAGATAIIIIHLSLSNANYIVRV